MGYVGYRSCCVYWVMWLSDIYGSDGTRSQCIWVILCMMGHMGYLIYLGKVGHLVHISDIVCIGSYGLSDIFG